MPKSLFLLAALVLVACDGTKTEVPGAPKPVMPTDAPAPMKLTLDDLQKDAQNIALVPSPVETQRALQKAGIADGIAKLVPDRSFKLDGDNKDVIAVRTGVVLADALLTLKTAPDDKLVARLTLVKSGMNGLGAGDDIARTLDDMIARIQNKGVTRDDLVKEMDELQGGVVPEIKYQAGDQALPLIQAGSWLAGANLVAQAVLASNKPDVGSALLRQPQVVEYFQKYARVEGTNRVPSEMLKQLDSALTTLLDISRKRALTTDDITQVKTTTDQVLALL